MNRLKFIKYFLQKSPIYFPGLDVETRKKRNSKIISLLKKIESPVYYVLGNHELKLKNGFKAVNNYQGYKDWFGKLFLENHYYSWDISGVHFVALNTNENYKAVFTEIFSPKFFSKGCFNVSKKQLDWLKHDLKKTNFPTVVFCHVPIDDKSISSYDIVRNAKDIRNIIYKSGKVISVVQAHSHHMSGPNLKGYTVNLDTIPYIYLPSFGSRVVGPKCSLLEIDANKNRVNIKTFRVDESMPISNINNKKTRVLVINDIHYGSQRWDLYSEVELKKFLKSFTQIANKLKPNFVLVNGDWIDGHM